MVESDRGNPVLKLDIYHPSHIETVYGWKGYNRLKTLDNLVSPEDIREYKRNLKMTDELWSRKHNKYKENTKKICNKEIND